jgi:phosphatidylethanolamine/phosphatidyl-N-methylethanolamine N-methyltransferase
MRDGQRHLSSVAETLLFMRKFLRHGTRVASFSPSSQHLAHALCEGIDATVPQVVLELGAGTGAVTAAACTRMHPLSRLIAVEIDPQFAAIVTQRCPQAEVLACDVRDLEEQLAARGVEKVDLVISGLPTPSLPRAVNEAVLACLKQCAPDACFSQLTVMPWVYQGMYRRLFEEVRFRPVWRNLPPGGVYHCRRLRSDYRRYIPGKAR